ncbi:hypothetical protein [Lysobacter sp. CA199]|uniref:hypothetical protein n=1 Tax=Lysobacter sp. CA199 TaxID=3455608 RepID=UPI003F8D779F
MGICTNTTVIFDVSKRHPLAWLVSIDDAPPIARFTDREIALAAARAHARLRHLDDDVSTEVRMTTRPGNAETIIRFGALNRDYVSIALGGVAPDHWLVHLNTARRLNKDNRPTDHNEASVTSLTRSP